MNMKKLLRTKLIEMCLVGLAGLVLLGALLLYIQTGLSMANQNIDFQDKLAQIDTLMANRAEEAASITESYDDIFISKAQSLAYIAQNDPQFEMTDEYMREMKDLLQVDNAMVLNQFGVRVAAAERPAIDYTVPRYNQLRTVFLSDAPSIPFEVTVGGETMRYYGASIDNQHMAVITRNPQELNNAVESASAVPSVLSNVSIGLDGFAFAVSHLDYTFTYHPDPELMGKDAFSAGLTPENLKDGATGWITIAGNRYYCASRVIGDTSVICAVTESEINASRSITVLLTLLTFAAVLIVVIGYAIFLKQEEIYKHTTKDKDYLKIGNLWFNKSIFKKITSTAIIGVIAVFAISMCVQTLFMLSRQSVSNSHHIQELSDIAAKNDAQIDLLESEYNERYLNKCQTAAYILEKNPALITKEGLKTLGDILQVDSMHVFGPKGETLAASDVYWDFVLSADPEAQSYPFRELLKGYREYLIQAPQMSESGDKLTQYIGVPLRDGDQITGLVQISVSPTKLQDMLHGTQITEMLEGVKVGAHGFAFAVNKSDLTFAYYPTQKLIGRSVYDYGMTDFELKDDFSDYITVNGEKFFASSLESADDYVYIAIPNAELTRYRLPVAACSAGASLICLALIVLILTLDLHKRTSGKKRAPLNADAQMVDVDLPDGRVGKTVAIQSRFSNTDIHWGEKTAGQRMSAILKTVATALALLLLAAYALRDRIFAPGSIIHYILSGNWERSVNLFSVISCALMFIMVNTISAIVRKLLVLFSRTIGPRGETVCRLLDNLILYCTIIGAIYYCMSMLGADTSALLTSAGILSLIVGLGSQSLISDIIAGLFIVFDGEFRVGDIVTIGDCTGTVQEIGVRTTKIEDGNKNIKIISNRNVTGIVNMTKQSSVASCTFNVEYGESLANLENILAAELGSVKEHLPAILEGPTYKGISALYGNKVGILITAQCAEKDRAQLTRDLNREIKLLFDKHGITV